MISPARASPKIDNERIASSSPSGAHADRQLIEYLVLPDRIELSTSPLPRECSTTELRQHAGDKRRSQNENRPIRHPRAAGSCHKAPLRASTQASRVADKICRKIKAGRRPAVSGAAFAGRVPNFGTRPPFSPADRLTNGVPETRYATERQQEWARRDSHGGR